MRQSEDQESVEVSFIYARSPLPMYHVPLWIEDQERSTTMDESAMQRAFSALANKVESRYAEVACSGRSFGNANVSR